MRVIMFLKYLQSQGYKSAVIRTSDTDLLIFILLLHASKFSIQIIPDIGYRKYRQKLNINFLAQKFGEKYCSMLAGIYVITGENLTSAFKGKGKLGPQKKLNRPHHQEAFRYKTKSQPFTSQIYSWNFIWRIFKSFCINTTLL